MTIKMDKAMLLGTREPTRYEDIKTFTQRCEEHQDHQQGMVSYDMLQQRLWEEIDELRAFIEQREWVGLTTQEADSIVAYPWGETKDWVRAIEKALKGKNA